MILIELNIKTELILFWFFFSLSIEDGNLYYAQVNLVNNPGFEDFISCSDCNQNITEATYWFQPNQWDWPNGGSDFYHTCNLNCTPPLIVSGYQNPRSGNGFGGGGVFYPTLNSNREYLETSMSQPLISAKQYCTFFYTNRSNYNNVSATDCIGLIFTVDSLLYNGVNWLYYDAVPNINNKTGDIIIDTLNWTLIKGVYSATGGEKFITIGCFLPHEQVNYICYPTSADCGYAYYYFDDFGVYELPEIDAGPGGTICEFEDSVQLQANCEGCWDGLQYRWWPETGLSDPSVLNPLAAPSETTTYYFGLIDSTETVPCIVDLVDSVTIIVCAGITPPTFNFTIQPNPGNAQIELVFTHVAEDTKLFLYDMRGRLVMADLIPKGVQNHVLDIQQLANAQYILKLENSEVKLRKKFVKM